jgi:hypothetical protein
MNASRGALRVLALAALVSGLAGPADSLPVRPDTDLPGWSATASRLPDRLDAAGFWALIEELSEPGGEFQSDNLVSNEDTYQSVIPDLMRRARPGGAYIGVGPDQNFTYVVALQPRIAFITDIRRGNLVEHLMYKALVEQSIDRADFLSRLFSRARPEGLHAGSTADELFEAYGRAAAKEDRYRANVTGLLAFLDAHRGVPLAAPDREQLTSIYRRFVDAGPALTYAGWVPGRRNRYPSYERLQTAAGPEGVGYGYLASEANFRVLKALQQRNLIVPLVGDFAGPRTLRAVGAYLRAHDAVVSAFYTSNVEAYLFEDATWSAFARNVAALPLDEASTFIRSCFNSCSRPPGTRSLTLLGSMSGLVGAFAAGRVTTYWDVLDRSR